MVKRGRVWQINLASIGSSLFLSAAIYLGIKLVPPYWNAYKVDRALDASMFEVAKLDMKVGHSGQTTILDDLTQSIVALGIDKRYLHVYFAPDMSALHADYNVIVQFIAEKTIQLDFERSVRIP